MPIPLHMKGISKMFIPPDKETLEKLSVTGLADLASVATSELKTLRASINEAEVTDEQLEQMEGLQSFIIAAGAEIEDREAKAARLAAATEIPVETIAKLTAAVTDTPGTVDVSASVTTAAVANSATEVVEATITAATAVAPRRSVGVSDVAVYAPTPDVAAADEPYTIVAAGALATSSTDIVPAGSRMNWRDLGGAFVQATQSHAGISKSGARTRQQSRLAVIRRNFGEDGTIGEHDSTEQAYGKLMKAADSAMAITAANGWCAPSETDYSINSPITADGLLSIPERVLRRGGLNHNQGLDFGDFFGNDFVLPIPGYNILTEAQVIADTAKTCVEIPCPTFIDERLNVAALCLTSSLLQNRGYPEFVSTFVEGAVMSMAHLVNREVINAIVTGSVNVTGWLTVDPWLTDGTVWSQVMSGVDFAAMDLRYVYRARQDQVVDIVLPYWVYQALRADYIRRNAAANDDLTDEIIRAAFARRNVRPQFVYDWQDAFNPGAIPVTNQMGSATPLTLYNVPTTLQFLAFLPGTWVLGRQDVIRLDTVYDSTNLQQNLVTQLFMEDGFLPMRMAQHSRQYNMPICANGSTGVQRAVTCTDVTP